MKRDLFYAKKSKKSQKNKKKSKKQKKLTYKNLRVKKIVVDMFLKKGGTIKHTAKQ